MSDPDPVRRRRPRRLTAAASTADLALPGPDRPADAGTSVELTRRLLAYLAAGGIQPGQRLPGERALASQLNVGRNVLREALKSLTVLGFLEVRQGDGTFLATNTSDLLPRIVEWGLFLGDHSIDALVEARTHLEITLAGLAAEHADPVGLGRIEQFYSFMELAAETGDGERYAAADIEFHLAIAAASGNSVLAGVLTNVRSLLHAWTEKVLGNDVSLADSLALHTPILAAIKDHDVPTARATMTEHMRQAVANLNTATAVNHQRVG